MTKTLVGIPTFNGAHRVDSLLQSISMRTGKDIDYKIVICDDSGNKDHQEKTKSIIDKWSSDLSVSILINEKNNGVAKSWNRIIKSDEESQHIVLINDDIIVAKDWLENLVYFLDNNPNAGAVCYDCLFINEEDVSQLLSSLNPIIKPRHPFTRVQIDNFDYNKDTSPIRCMVAWGCFIGFRRDMYNLVGGFDENYFAYFEEYDFLTNLASHGYPNYILRSPKNWHVWGATSKSAPELNIGDVFEKSRQYYINKWNGDHVTDTDIFMSRIPFQKVKWICNNKTYEGVLIDNHGHFNKDEININIIPQDTVKIEKINISEIKDLTKINIVDVKKFKIGIGLPLGKEINSEFLRMILGRLEEWMHKYIVSILIDTHIPLDRSRNNIVEMAKQQNCDYLFFIDSDVLIKKDHLERLLSYGKDAITGVYYQRISPYNPIMRKRVAENLYIPVELNNNINNNDIIEVDGSGMGCFLIKTDIFDRIPYPWFEFKYHKVHGKWDQLAEDLYFCQKLQNIGIKIYCDPIVQCTHVGTSVHPELSRLYREYRVNAANERDITINELSEFTGLSSEDIYSKYEIVTELAAKDYILYKENPKNFYKKSKNYIFDQILWHSTTRRNFDIDLVKSIKEKYPFARKILDFGSGCGQNALELAKAGYDVSITDFDGYTSQFARFRSKKRGLDIKFYDIEKPIKDKFDIILVFDVLDHIPYTEFGNTIELLRSLKTEEGKVLITTNFVKEDIYPMRYEATPEKLELIEKLNRENTQKITILNTF